MKKSNQYQYTPTVEDYCLFMKEYTSTREGKLSFLFGYRRFVGILLSTMIIIFVIYLIWSKTIDYSSGITIGPFVIDKSILFAWGYSALLIITVFIRPIFFPKGVFRQIYNSNPDQQSPKVIDISNTFYHERDIFAEVWFLWDSIYHAIKTDNFYILSVKDLKGIFYIPIKCLDENGKTFFDELINKASNNSRNYRDNLQLNNEIKPLSSNKSIRLNREVSLTDCLTVSIERTWFLSPLYKIVRIGAIGILFCAFGSLIFPFFNFLFHMRVDFKPSLILFIAALFLFFVIPVCRLITCLINFVTNKNRHVKIKYIIDENGYFFGLSSIAFNLFWNYFSKIVITKRNIIFKAKHNNCVYTIPKKWLTEFDSKTLEEIIAAVVENNPGLTLKIVNLL